ncbi:MAG: hypothetical protein ACP5N9_04920 [Candidatus Bilamarchaeum sp.]|jgi:predicted DNA-binding protein (UPF0251 family)
MSYDSRMSFGSDEGFSVVPQVKRGRPRKGFSQDKLEQVMRLYFLERMSMREVANTLGMSHMSVYRMLSDPNVEVLM